MNKLILQQLQKLGITQKPWFNENLTEISFFKQQAQHLPEIDNELSLAIDHVYIVRFESYIVNPPPDFTLAQQWNREIPILDCFALIEVNQILGKMVKFTGCGYDYGTKTPNDNMYTGMWVPLKSITVLERIS